jgi:hypothetical protein
LITGEHGLGAIEAFGGLTEYGEGVDFHFMRRRVGGGESL